MNDQLNISSWTCPLPLQNYPTIVMGHGSGGKMMSDLIRHMFLPLLDNEALNQLGDAAVLELDQSPSRVAFSTDSFVVSPLIFPGGNIGELAVYGTVNDLAMTGAQPLFLSAGFILEEGLPMETLGEITTSFSAACQAVNVQVVTGDTKVVNKGQGDGLYINTTGIGLIPAEVAIAPENAQAGDAVIVSGTVGDHGMAIMSVREGLEFETRIVSDTSPLHELVETMLAASLDIHCLRDATRGGVAAALHELAKSSQVGITFEENKIPLRPAVKAACEMLGMDPLYVANEGKLVAIVKGEVADEVLAAMHSHPLGRDAVLIGRVVADHPGMVLAKTSIGGSRVVDLPAGELLPRIC
jgi:hydrogenase expression/formation protein HypE